MLGTYYNGLLEFNFSVVIKSSNHENCLLVSKKMKEYFSAWYFCCNQSNEHKSARKGDVLNRELQAKVKGYSSDIVAFREGMRCICFHYDLYLEDTTVRIIDRGTTPIDK